MPTPINKDAIDLMERLGKAYADERIAEWKAPYRTDQWKHDKMVIHWQQVRKRIGFLADILRGKRPGKRKGH